MGACFMCTSTTGAGVQVSHHRNRALLVMTDLWCVLGCQKACGASVPRCGPAGTSQAMCVFAGAGVDCCGSSGGCASCCFNPPSEQYPDPCVYTTNHSVRSLGGPRWPAVWCAGCVRVQLAGCHCAPTPTTPRNRKHSPAHRCAKCCVLVSRTLASALCCGVCSLAYEPRPIPPPPPQVVVYSTPDFGTWTYLGVALPLGARKVGIEFRPQVVFNAASR
jgi:hypothetical protein